MKISDSLGTSRASGAGSLIWAVVAAIVVMSTIISIYVFTGQKPPAVEGEITHVWVHPIHSLMRSVQGPGMQGGTDSFDEVLILSQVRLHNQSNARIVLSDMLTTVTLGDGPHESYAAASQDFENIFVAYPEIKGLHGTPLKRDTSITPGETIDGMVVSSFQVPPSEWAKSKDIGLTFRFPYHKDLVLVPAAGTLTTQ